MKNVNKTLYIPLYGKAYVSQRNILLKDKKAEEIWTKEHFELGRKSKSKYLSYYMAMRAKCFDEFVENKNDLVLHLGCGLDSRYERCNYQGTWYDIDFEDVIEERKKYYKETERYHMFSADLKDVSFISQLPKVSSVTVLMEGVSMYLKPEELRQLFTTLKDYYPQMDVLMDVYTTLAAKASKYKNPINEVSVYEVYGYDDPTFIDLEYVQSINMTPNKYIIQLPKSDQFIFKHLYAGNISKKLYRLYQLKK